VQRRTRFFAAATWAAWVLCSGQSQASDPAPATDDPAAAAFKRSLDLYATGDLPGALDAMRESHRLSNRTELLYNIARIEEELDDCPASLADYSRYLELVPAGRYRLPAQEARQKLAARCPAPSAPTVASVATKAPEPAVTASASPTPAVNEPPVQAKPWLPPSTWGWAAVALGAAAGAGAVYFMVEAVDAHDRFQGVVNAHKNGSGPLDMSLQDQQHRDQTWAQVLAVTSGALVTGGVVGLLIAPRGTTPPASTASLYLTPGQLGASFSQSF
jgi:hypothetical protein